MVLLLLVPWLPGGKAGHRAISQVMEMKGSELEPGKSRKGSQVLELAKWAVLQTLRGGCLQLTFPSSVLLFLGQA